MKLISPFYTANFGSYISSILGSHMNEDECFLCFCFYLFIHFFIFQTLLLAGYHLNKK